MAKRVYEVVPYERNLVFVDQDGSLYIPETTKAVLVKDLRLPIHICLGHYEAATNEELDDVISDFNHELQRRATRVT